MRIYVLSIGINDYGGQIAIPNLYCSVNDAYNVYRVFRTLYNADGQFLSSDEPPASAGPCKPRGRGTRAEILQAFNEARRYLEPKDLFVFFFSGHGVQDAHGYILPHSAEFGRSGTYLMHKELFGMLSTLLPCRHIMYFLNCCYAGTAALPTRMPGMIVPRKRAVLYTSTDHKTKTPDRLPGSRNECSPFAQALIDYLERETAIGASFSPEALAAYIAQHATVTLRLEDDTTAVVRPMFVSSLPAVGSGNFPFEVRRPGFGVEVGSTHRCATGETLRVPVRVEGATTVKWAAQSRLAGFEPARKEFRNGTLELVFPYPGDFDIEIVAENVCTGEKACRTLAIHVYPGQSPPPSLDEQPLALCERGRPYSDNLRITGGTAPFRVTLEGLPDGLQHELCDLHTIRIHGTAPSAGGGGTPLSADNGRVLHMIDIHVEDSAGRQYHERRRFVVYNPEDYCHVQAGKYCIGCKEDAMTMQAICNVIRLDMEQTAKTARLNVDALRAMLDRVAAGAADQVFRGIVSCAPYACVQMQSYLIKKYPVTRHDWKRFIDETGKPYTPLPQSSAAPDDLKKPMTDITYEALCAYLDWKGTRLPTGREWQVAADGGRGFLFPWGNEFCHANCNLCEDPGRMDLTPVDAFDEYAGPTGTCDMVGNIYEWVDRRVYWHEQRKFAQVFRGGSYRHAPLCGIISRDSDVVGVLFGADANAAQVGQTAFDWLGFRDVIDLDPTPEWGQNLVVIPAGGIQAGDGPRHVPQFRMARYAVSNVEYWEFVRATGHRRPEGWERHGDTLPFAHDQRHLPVVNVSYLDAHAFCLWKSRTKGGIYRLPTPEQWLAALQGGQNRQYPWGGGFNLQFCNEITSGWGKRVPVFDLPEGQSRQGVYNLVGNVYEWVGPLEVRGGSWLTDCQALSRTWYRTNVAAAGAFDFRDGDVGFRYVVLDPPFSEIRPEDAKKRTP